MLLRALGYSTNADIFKAFNCIEEVKLRSKNTDSFIGSTVIEDVIDQETGEIFLEGGVELTSENLNELKQAKAVSYTHLTLPTKRIV